MENSIVSGLRSRSRSKTPILRSSLDQDLTENVDKQKKSGRKTPTRRNTPVKNLLSSSRKSIDLTIIEDGEDNLSPPAHYTRQSARNAVDKVLKTSDYSSEESPDRLKPNYNEISQNKLNYQHEYELVSTTSTTKRSYGETSSFADVTISPIISGDYSSRSQSYYGGTHRYSRHSPAYSGTSTDSSFAEQALADVSTLVGRDPEHSWEHLPYRLYRMAGEYWNKYPKTDYTYSPLSKDRVELAPGQVAVPNMSRRSLSQFRVQGPNTSSDELDQLIQQHNAWKSTAHKRFDALDSSEDEGVYTARRRMYTEEKHWWITRIIIAIYTAITTTTSNMYQKIVGPSNRYTYAGRRASNQGLLSKSATVLTAPFYWIYSIFRKIVTTISTTVTETVTPNHVGQYTTYASTRRVQSSKQRSYWPWFLLFLIPLAAYGCYSYSDVIVPQKNTPVDKFEPTVVQDAELSKRISALENWAVNVDSKMKIFGEKLSKLDNIEAQIESYSLKHLQQNLIQIFNINGDSDTMSKLKEYFNKHYISKEDMQSMSQEIHERLINAWKPDLDEDRIRNIVQGYLSVFEKRQLEITIEKVKEYVKEIHIERLEYGFDVEAVKKIVTGMLDIYDADKTGLVDFALESAGGQVISTKCTELYQIKTKQYSILGFPVWWVYTSPRFALTPGAMPAECWAFQGFPGYLVIRTYAIIEVTGFSLEHMSRLLAADGKIESAPKNFSVYGLQNELDTEPHLFGDYFYDENGTSIQYFPVKYPKTINIGKDEYPVAYDIIELRVESNYGNPTYTCVYRFRVHGNPLSDIRKATEDSMRDGS